jgi:CarD family transcriptional regulator
MMRFRLPFSANPAAENVGRAREAASQPSALSSFPQAHWPELSKWEMVGVCFDFSTTVHQSINHASWHPPKPAPKLPFFPVWPILFMSFLRPPSIVGTTFMINGSFHIGDKVVYPNRGVGIIEQIGNRTMGATVEKFYLLNIKSSSLKVMVPFEKVASVGLRRVVRNGEIQKIVDFLTDGECNNNSDWKYRFKENSERMGTGSLLEVAAVLKSLLLLSQSKPLSFREKKMLERARYLLVSELAVAKNCAEAHIEEMLSKALSKSSLRFPEASEFQA